MQFSNILAFSLVRKIGRPHKDPLFLHPSSPASFPQSLPFTSFPFLFRLPPVLYSSYSAALLFFIPHILHLLCSLFLISCISSVLYSSYPESLMFFIPHILHIFCSSFLISCISSVIYSSYPESLMFFTPHILHIIQYPVLYSSWKTYLYLNPRLGTR